MSVSKRAYIETKLIKRIQQIYLAVFNLEFL